MHCSRNHGPDPLVACAGSLRGGTGTRQAFLGALCSLSCDGPRLFTCIAPETMVARITADSHVRAAFAATLTRIFTTRQRHTTVFHWDERMIFDGSEQLCGLSQKSVVLQAY